MLKERDERGGYIVPVPRATMPTPTKQKRKVMTVWVGYSDGQPLIHKDDRYENNRHLSVYPSHAAASREFEDVRKARLEILE